eukprot:s2692_g4.t1
MQLATPLIQGASIGCHPALECCACILWLLGWCCLTKLVSGEPSPYILCLSVAVHVRIPPPLGQGLPLPDFLLIYLTGHSTFYACCFGGLFWWSSSSWRLCWLLASFFCLLATGRRRWALSRLPTVSSESLRALRPSQPMLTLLHPYLYYFLSELPGASEVVRIQRMDPPSLRMPVDVWRSSADLPSRPVLFLIHGGAWRGGEARCSPQAPVLHALASSGFLVVSCEYRRLPGTQWPMQLEDCEAAFKWLQDEAATLGADLSKVSIAGTSAGGHIAALLLARMLNERSENAEHGIRVSAMLLFYPALDPADRTGNTVSSPFSCSCLGVRRGMSFLAWYFEKFVLQDRQLWPSAEPLGLLQSASQEVAAVWPPTLIIHGEMDGVVPVEHSRSFLASLGAASAGGSCESDTGGEESGRGFRSVDRLLVVPLARHIFEIAAGDLASASYDAAIGWLSQLQDRCQKRCVAE